MVAGCPVAEDGEHYGINGKLVKLSVDLEPVDYHDEEYIELELE